MTAWLQRECGTIFLDGSREAEEAARQAEEAAEIEIDDENAAIAAAAAAAGTAAPHRHRRLSSERMVRSSSLTSLGRPSRPEVPRAFASSMSVR